MIARALLVLTMAGCEPRWSDMPGAPVQAWAPTHSDVDQQRWAQEVLVAAGTWNVTMWQLGCPEPFVVTDHGHKVWLVKETAWAWGPNNGGVADLGDPGWLAVRGNRARGHQAVLLHELGHAIGLDHTQDGPSIMTPSIGVDTLQLVDLAAAACALACGPC